MFGSLAGSLSRLDVAAFHWVIDHRWAPLSAFMVLLSHGGAWTWVGAGAVLALVFRRTGVFAGAYQSAMAIGFATLFADTVVKPLLGRARPYHILADLRVMAGLQCRPSTS